MTNYERWNIATSQRNWMTAEEFLAQIAAHRLARLKHPLKTRKPFVPGPFSRTYVLKPNHRFYPKPETVAKPEVAL